MKDCMAGLSVDCVIFGFDSSELKILVLKLKNMDLWALPGGFIKQDQDLDLAAYDVLKQRTGLSDLYLQQFHVFGAVDRIDHSHVKNMIKHDIVKEKMIDWFSKRFITIGYYALVEYSKVSRPMHDSITEKCEWTPLSSLPKMMLDHTQIINKAHERLKKDINHKPVGLNLLPEKFTMTELQFLYEAILQRKLDRRNFRRKILSLDILIETTEKRIGGSHKAPILFEFDIQKYNKAINEGFKSNWN